MSDELLGVVDHSRFPPMQLQPGDILQQDCKRLEPWLREGEQAQLQAVYDTDSYAMLSVEQLLFIRELELRARDER